MNLRAQDFRPVPCGANALGGAAAESNGADARGAPIGVFDSGIGGLSVLRALRAEMPHEHFVYLDDSLHAPYGERGDAHVSARSHRIARHLNDHHAVKAMVVACNTATMAAVASLRSAYPRLPIVGIEPGLKPAAAASRTRHVGVMATRGTIGSARFAALMASLGDQATFVPRACDGLADAIQQSLASDNEAAIASLCEHHLGAMGRFGCGAGEMDVLVLGCTHYVFAEAHLRRLLPRGVRVVSTAEAVARRTRQLLAACDGLAEGGEGTLRMVTSGEPGLLHAAARRWLTPGADEARQDSLAADEAAPSLPGQAA